MNTIRKSLLTALAAAIALPALLIGGASPAAAAAGPRLTGVTLTGVTLTLSHSTIYPRLDGYRDSLGIAVAKNVTGASGPSALTGSVTIKHGSRTIATHPITTSATETYAWSGRVAGKLTTGNYVVTAKVTGANTTITEHATVTVSARRLVTHTKVVTVSAQDFFQHGYSSTAAANGCTSADAGAISCASTSGGSVFGTNYAAVPAGVLEYAGYRPYTARVAVTISHASVVRGSHTYWEWNGAHRFSFTSPGTHTTSTVRFGASHQEQLVRFRVSSGSMARFEQVSITYGYAILK